MLELTDVIKQMGLRGIYRIFYPNTKEYMFFSTSHGTFSKIDYMDRYKVSFNRYKKIEITPSIPNYNRLKLDIKNNKNIRHLINSWKLNNSLPNETWVNTEIIKEIKHFLKSSENEHITYPNVGDTMKVVLRGNFIALNGYIKNWRDLLLAT